MTDITRVVAAAKAVIRRWDSPDWKDEKHTADYIAALRDAVQGLRDAEPVFYWRPLQDGLYEGPHHVKSVHGRLMREAKPGEWHPLYATPPTTDAPAQWRPIETAPKDGTRISLASDELGVVWNDCRWQKTVRVPDRWESFVGRVPFEPTHWAPQLAAPRRAVVRAAAAIGEAMP